MQEQRLTFEPGMHAETWLVRCDGEPVGAVGYAEGDGRWRAAWHGALVGTSYDTRTDAARALIERRRAGSSLARAEGAGEQSGSNP